MRNRCCAGDPGRWADPGGAPWRRVSGFHLVGSDAALPPKAAASFAPVYGKAVTGKNKIKRLTQEWAEGGAVESGLQIQDAFDGLPQFPHPQNEGDHFVQTECQTSCAQCLAQEGPRETWGRVHVRKGWWQQGQGQSDHCFTHLPHRGRVQLWLRAAGPGRGRGHPRLAQGGWYPLIPICPMDPK